MEDFFPNAPKLTAAESPHEVPPLMLPPIDDTFGGWDMDDVREFGGHHEDVIMKVRMGTMRACLFQEHVAKIPRAVLSAKNLTSKMPPTMRVCEKIDELIAEASAFWATQG